MTIDEEEFFKNLGIVNINKLKKISSYEHSKIFNGNEIDFIAHYYGIYTKEQTEKVCIKNILGYNLRHCDNIFFSIPYYFNRWRWLPHKKCGNAFLFFK